MPIYYFRALQIETFGNIYPDFPVDRSVLNLPESHRNPSSSTGTVISSTEFTTIPADNFARSQGFISCRFLIAKRPAAITAQNYAGLHAIVSPIRMDEDSASAIRNELQNGSQIAVFDNPWCQYGIDFYSPEVNRLSKRNQADAEDMFWNSIGLAHMREQHPDINVIEVAPPFPDEEHFLGGFSTITTHEGVSFWVAGRHNKYIEPFMYYPMNQLFQIVPQSMGDFFTF